VVIPADGAVHELDGLFVEPAHMQRGVGRALVEDAARRALADGARCLEVTAGPPRASTREWGSAWSPARRRALAPPCGCAASFRLDREPEIRHRPPPNQTGDLASPCPFGLDDPLSAQLRTSERRLERLGGCA
jgi:hypothetical protein